MHTPEPGGTLRRMVSAASSRVITPVTPCPLYGTAGPTRVAAPIAPAGSYARQTPDRCRAAAARPAPHDSVARGETRLRPGRPRLCSPHDLPTNVADAVVGFRHRRPAVRDPVDPAHRQGHGVPGREHHVLRRLLVLHRCGPDPADPGGLADGAVSRRQGA